MTKREVFKLFEQITLFYDSFEISQEKVNQWHLILKDYTYSELEKNLNRHVTLSAYPPKISELLCKTENTSRVIPNVEETLDFLYQKESRASEAVVRHSLEKLRQILGIQRGGK